MEDVRNFRTVEPEPGRGARSVARGAKAESERRDMPPRRILRDDLIVELAKRRVSDPKQIRNVRGWNGAICSGLCHN